MATHLYTVQLTMVILTQLRCYIVAEETSTVRIKLVDMCTSGNEIPDGVGA